MIKLIHEETTIRKDWINGTEDDGWKVCLNLSSNNVIS